MIDFQDPGPDYELVWPRELFVSEARAILRRRGDRSGETELLLREVFVGDTAVEDYRAFVSADPWSPGTTSPGFLESLVASADRLPSRSTPRPYWRTRNGAAPADRPIPDGAGLRREWAQLVTELQQRGYLETVAPQTCVDDRDTPDPDPTIAAEIDRRCGLQLVWPPAPWSTTWSEDEFWELVEVVHDLMARPRGATYHDFGGCGCGWHYHHHSPAAGQAVYRWRVNELLTRYGVDLELAEQGEDRGRLVRVPSDGRGSLLQQVAPSFPTPSSRATVEHAIALFRSRTATSENKRSACVALARVLEERREQLKADLLSKDEGALFQIANQFAVRHQRADQRPDYDEFYLDWLFWWYLATIELTNRLLTRKPDSRGASA